MKNVNYLNYFFVGVPATLLLFDFIRYQGDQSALTGIALIFSILTGLFQVTIGGSMLMDEPRNKSLQAYILGVVFYFVMLFINPGIDRNLKIYFLFTIPALLAIYLTVLIYKRAHK